MKATEAEMRSFLEMAILAPSTHNSQPWKFRIDDSILYVSIDETRLLPEADVLRRDAYISLGCAIENFVLTARNSGWKPNISYADSGDYPVVAKIFLEKSEIDKSVENLVETIPRRINARGNFTKEELPLFEIENHIRKMETENYFDAIKIKIITDREVISKIASITEKGIKEAHHNTAFRKELSNWMPNALSARKNGLQWYSLHMPYLLSFFIPTLIRHTNVGHILATKSASGINTSKAGFIFLSESETPQTWLQVGRCAERLMLYIQSLGFHTSIYVGGIEIGDNKKDFINSAHLQLLPQFFFVAGKISVAHSVSPREPLITKLQ